MNHMESPHHDLQIIGAPLELVLKEQVVVGWLDKAMGRRKYLGQLCGSDTAKASLTLHVRRDPQIHQRILISIHVPVKIHASTSERPRDMYVVIPADELSMAVDTREESDHVRSYVGEKHLEVRFSLNAPAFVVMPIPRRKLQKPITGVPAEILSCLQTLSEANHLELYLASSDSVRRCLLDIRSSLQMQWPKTTTPTIDYRSTYPNGCSAAANCWAKYPRVEASSSCWNPLVEDAPPQYDEVPSPPRPKEASPLASTPVAGDENGSPASPIESPIFQSTPGKHVETLKRKAQEALSDDSDEPRLRDSPLDSELTPTQVVPTPLWIHTPEHQPEVTSNSRSDGDAAESLDQSSAESLARRLHAAAAALSPCSTIPNSFPPPSPPPHPPSRRTPVPSIATGVMPDIRPPVDTVPHPPAPPLGNSPPSPVRTPKPNDDLLFHDLAQLILHTSRLLANVHDAGFTQLLHLGRCARERDETAFHAQRATLMWAVVQRCAAAAAAPPTTTTYSWTDNVEAHVCYVQRWMNRKVCRNADLYLLPDLVRLQAAALRVKDATTAQQAREDDDGGAERERAKRLFEMERAVCFAGVFYLFGGRV